MGTTPLEQSLREGPDTSRAYMINDNYLFWIEVDLGQGVIIPFAGLITPRDMKFTPKPR